MFDIGVDTSALKKAETPLKGFVESLRGAGAALAGAFAVTEIKDFIAEQIELGSHLRDTADRLGLGTDELQAFSYAAKLSGVDADSAAHALGFLNKNVGLAVTGNAEAAKAFAGLGISLKDANGNVRPTTDVVLDLADKVDGLGSTAEKTAAITKVLGKQGAALIPVFLGGAKAVKASFDEFEDLGGGMSGEFVEAADAAGDQIDKLKMAFTSIKSQLAGAFLPIITAVAKKVTAWSGAFARAAKGTNLMKTAMLFLGVVGAGSLGKILGPLGKLIGLTSGGKTSIMGMVTSFLKFGAPLLVLGALFLLVEDLVTLMRGGKSVIGEWLDQLYGVGTAAAFIQQLKDAWAQVTTALKDAQPQIDAAITAFAAYAKDVLPLIIVGFVDLVKVLAQAVSLLAQGADILLKWKAGELTGMNVLTKANDAYQGLDKAAVQKVRGWFGMQHNDGATPPGFVTPSPIPSFNEGKPVGAGEYGPQLPSGPVTQKNDIKVAVMTQPGADNKAVGEAAKAGIKTGVKQAEYRNAAAAVSRFAATPG